MPLSMMVVRSNMMQSRSSGESADAPVLAFAMRAWATPGIIFTNGLPPEGLIGVLRSSGQVIQRLSGLVSALPLGLVQLA